MKIGIFILSERQVFTVLIIKKKCSFISRFYHLIEGGSMTNRNSSAKTMEKKWFKTLL